MGVGANLGAPGANDKILGKFTNMRFYLPEATAPENPATATSLYGVQAFDFGDPDIKFTSEVFQFGGGDEFYNMEIGRSWPFTIEFLQGKAWAELAKLLGITLSLSGTTLVPLVKKNDYPNFILEAVCRQTDNDTHVGSVIIPDIILSDITFSQVIDDDTFTVTGMFKRVPALLMAGAELVYEQFVGDGSTTDFTLASTPLELTTATEWDEYDLDNTFYIKEKASAASTGTIKKSGYSITTTTLTAATAPAVGTVVQILYAKATV